ncbi:MAG: acyl-CoA dehydrogenase family protein [Chloroflexi bacterium]|nr:acyl-CoA dehydrogenase family protein [Chloroflexota bacterium]
MDFSFTPEEEGFRGDVRDFLAARLPRDWDFRDFVGEVSREERFEAVREMNRALADRRWLALPWDEQSGGLGAGHLSQAIFADESAYARMPGGGGAAVSAIGPAIRQLGTEEQRRRWLSRIADGKDTWCVLYTEPGAGSDVAAIQTWAERRGDDYVVNGVKTLIAGADRATMGWLAARTAPVALSSGGISTFAVPMDLPGISIRSMPDIAGDDDLNEVTFDDVHVPALSLVGEEHGALEQVVDTSAFEQSGVEAFAAGKRHLERLIDAVRDATSLMTQSPGARYELADRWIELQVGYQVAYRVPLLQREGHPVDSEASESKLYGSELTQRIAATGMRLLGPPGQLAAGSRHAKLGGAFSRLYLQATAATVAGGTSEVQRNSIAQRGLGLQRV